MAEFPVLGRHCALNSCKQLDFLPFLCARCQLEFCSEHKQPESHECSETTEVEQTSAADDVIASGKIRPFSCSLMSCQLSEFIKIVCPDCQLNFCVKHRHATDHDCQHMPQQSQLNRKPLSAQVKRNAPTENSTIDPNRPVKKLSNAADQKRLDKVTLMRLKMKATGDKGIAESDRVYIRVIAPGTTVQTAFFVSNKWSVGKCLDQIAKFLNVKNRNNEINSKKLRFYLEDSTEFLEMSENIAKVIQSGTILRLQFDV